MIVIITSHWFISWIPHCYHVLQKLSVNRCVKNGLSYKEAFDEREAVDKIAYIIEITDPNLALLLGGALDAQKFFHDVTYDRRLQDSPYKLYQFGAHAIR